MFPEFFEREMHDDHEGPPPNIPSYKPRPISTQISTESFIGRMEKQRSYCRAVPIFRNPTPKQDAKILVKGTVTLPLWASSNSGKITRYEVSTPHGMECRNLPKKGIAVCRWTPSEDQGRVNLRKQNLSEKNLQNSKLNPSKSACLLYASPLKTLMDYRASGAV